MLMSSPSRAIQSDAPANAPRAHWAGLLAIAGAVTLLHLLTNGRYGFHRDELQFLSDARHMDWGFVAYPPFTPAVERISMALFGLSLVGLRLASVLTQAAAIVATGLMARELGGRDLAQIAAALAVAFSPLPMFEGTEFQYSTFDYLWWTLIGLFIIRLLRSGNPRWWMAIGATVGVGLLTKYSIVFLIAGILAGVVLSEARRFLKSPWFYASILLAFLICLPNFLWQVRHQFISYDFLQHIHMRDVGQGRADGFLAGQFRINVNLVAAPLWIAGLIAFFRSRRYRMLGWVFVVTVALFYFAKGRDYYTAGAYPMLLAMGAATAEGWLRTLPIWGRRTAEGIYFAAFAACAAYIIAVAVPLALSGPLRDFALKHNGDLREEIGWNELVKTVASIRDSLPAEQRASLGITDGNYGEHGAIEILGPAYGLPAPIGTTNSAWLRGYPTPPPTTLIVLGLSQEDANALFTNCRLAGHNGNAEGVRNEESVDHPDIFVCGPPRMSWPELWAQNKSFG
jgi:hypothetical protein